MTVRVFVADTSAQTAANIRSQWPDADVQSVMNWSSLLGELRAFRPHVFIVDAAASGAELPTLLPQMKQHSETLAVSVLAIVEEPNADLLATLRQAGVSGFSGRPFEPSLLSRFSAPEADDTMADDSLDLDPEASEQTTTQTLDRSPADGHLANQLVGLSNLAASLDSPALDQERFQVLAERSRALLAVDRVQLFSRSGDGMSVLLLADSAADGQPGLQTADPLDPVVAKTLKSGQPMCVDHTTSPDGASMVGAPVDYDSVLCAPCGSGMGALLCTHEMPRGYTHSDRSVAELLAHLLGLLISATTLVDRLEAGELGLQGMQGQGMPAAPLPPMGSALPPMPSAPVPQDLGAPPPPPPVAAPQAPDTMDNAIADLLAELDNS